MPTYSDDALAEIAAAFASLPERENAILMRFIQHPFATALAKEHAAHGYVRRMRLMVHCIRRIFEILPPELDVIPGRDALADATSFFHAFMIDTSGCADNLAWIWVSEKNVLRADGSELPRTWVGLRPKNKDVLSSFPEETRHYLVHLLADWYEYHDGFRDALAHRISPYIPPYQVTGDNWQTHADLENRSQLAVTAGDYAGAGRLRVEAQAMRFFRPLFTHSLFDAGVRTVYLHAQIIADFATMEEAGNRIMDELSTH